MHAPLLGSSFIGSCIDIIILSNLLTIIILVRSSWWLASVARININII